MDRRSRPGPDLGGPPTDQLAQIVLDGFSATDDLDPLHQAISLEMQAVNLFATVFDQPGPHLDSILSPLADHLRTLGSPAADRALAALAAASEGPVGPPRGGAAFRRAWERRRSETSDPVATAIGEDRAVSAIEISHVQGDGVNLMLSMESALGSFTVAVYVDYNLGGLAKDLLIGPPIEEVLATFRPDGGFRHREVPIGEAAWRFDQALDITHQTLSAPVSEDFEDLLPYVAVRFAGIRPVEPASFVGPDGDPIAYVEVSRAERIAHLGAFGASLEFEAIPVAQRDDTTEVVDLWIDHAVDYTIGKARRVSPTLVELFCASWFPRKVMADVAMVDAAPTAIEAWLRFCARTTGLERRWLDEALRALEEFSPELGRALDDEGSWGLAKGLLSAGGAGLLDDLPADLEGVDIAALLAERALPPDVGSLAGWTMRDDLTWQPLEVAETGGRIHLEGDPSRVPPWQYVKTRMIASQASTQAAALLGPSFAQPAMDLAIEIGAAEPCPFDNTQISSWPGAIVWLLAEDNDAFSPRTVGHRRDDLADALPMTRATYQAKAKKVREVLGVEKGAFRIDR